MENVRSYICGRSISYATYSTYRKLNAAAFHKRLNTFQYVLEGFSVIAEKVFEKKNFIYNFLHKQISENNIASNIFYSWH